MSVVSSILPEESLVPLQPFTQEARDLYSALTSTDLDVEAIVNLISFMPASDLTEMRRTYFSRYGVRPRDSIRTNAKIFGPLRYFLLQLLGGKRRAAIRKSNRAAEKGEANANAKTLWRAVLCENGHYRANGPGYDTISDLLATRSDFELIDMCNAHRELYSTTVENALDRNCSNDLVAGWREAAKCCLPPDSHADTIFDDGSFLQPLPWAAEVAAIHEALTHQGDPKFRRSQLYETLSRVPSEQMAELQHVFNKRIGRGLVDCVREATSHGFQLLLLAMLDRKAGQERDVARELTRDDLHASEERAKQLSTRLHETLLDRFDSMGRPVSPIDAGYRWVVEFFVHRPQLEISAVVNAYDGAFDESLTNALERRFQKQEVSRVLLHLAELRSYTTY